MSDLTAQAAFERVQESAAVDDTRFARTIQIGEGVRQGDLYLFRVEPRIERGTKTGRQLAPGNTQGSRHVAAGRGVEVYAVPGGPLDGPVVVADRRWRLEHPEHADIDMPSGTYQVSYQRDFAAEQIRRVAD